MVTRCGGWILKVLVIFLALCIPFDRVRGEPFVSEAAASDVMSGLISDLVEDRKSPPVRSSSVTHPPPPPPPKLAIRRRVLRVIVKSEAEQVDCSQRGGSPCVRDDQCCLGKCKIQEGRCPTAQELFDAAATAIQKEKERKVEQEKAEQEEEKDKEAKDKDKDKDKDKPSRKNRNKKHSSKNHRKSEKKEKD